VLTLSVTYRPSAAAARLTNAYAGEFVRSRTIGTCGRFERSCALPKRKSLSSALVARRAPRHMEPWCRNSSNSRLWGSSLLGRQACWSEQIARPLSGRIRFATASLVVRSVPCSASSWYWGWLRCDGHGTRIRAGAESARSGLLPFALASKTASSCGRAVGCRPAKRAHSDFARRWRHASYELIVLSSLHRVAAGRRRMGCRRHLWIRGRRVGGRRQATVKRRDARRLCLCHLERATTTSMARGFTVDPPAKELPLSPNPVIPPRPPVLRRGEVGPGEFAWLLSRPTPSCGASES
jgi:hypothetical protein